MDGQVLKLDEVLGGRAGRGVRDRIGSARGVCGGKSGSRLNLKYDCAGVLLLRVGAVLLLRGCSACSACASSWCDACAR